MSAVVRLRRPIARLAATWIGISMISALAAPAQDLSGAERRKMQDMLRGVRTQIETFYYDSTYTGLNLAAVYDSAADRIRDARALDAALAAIAWFTLELHDSHTYFNPPPRTVEAQYGWEMRMVGDSCFVFRVQPGSDAERQEVHRGDRIESINGLVPTRDNLWQISYLFWVLSPRPSLRVVVRAPDGNSRTLDLASRVREHSKIMDVTGDDGGRDIGRLIREGERDAEDLRGQTFEAGPDILIWKMPTFEIPLDALRDAIKRTRGHKALVLDLRGNGGGFERIMLELVGQLSHDDVVVGKTRERSGYAPIVAKGARGN